ncbi:hypothetical protein ACFOUY_17965 [Pedobacter jamesrossensis]|uniref:Cold shock protein, CspA family n=2 Tax=Pedobacter jamesrossensis TaxID=1908238 RepID=A0ABV8NP56_9SPHI
MIRKGEITGLHALKRIGIITDENGEEISFECDLLHNLSVGNQVSFNIEELTKGLFAVDVQQLD